MTSLGVPSQADACLSALTVDLSDLSFRTQFLAFEHQPHRNPKMKQLKEG